MQVRWEYLTPPEFKKLVKEEQICILPLGILERHGEHLPYGTDGLSVHAIACRAAELEPCVVFPTYWFGQGTRRHALRAPSTFPPGCCTRCWKCCWTRSPATALKKS